MKCRRNIQGCREFRSEEFRGRWCPPGLTPRKPRPSPAPGLARPPDLGACLLWASAGLSRACPAHMDTARRPGRRPPVGHSDNESRDRRHSKPHLLPKDQRVTFHEIVKIQDIKTHLKTNIPTNNNNEKLSISGEVFLSITHSIGCFLTEFSHYLSYFHHWIPGVTVPSGKTDSLTSFLPIPVPGISSSCLAKWLESPKQGHPERGGGAPPPYS